MTAEKVLIVGQGLAGSVIAMQLRERGFDVWIVDENRNRTSSKVAAGLFNPIVAGRLKITWNAEELFEYFYNFYPKVEKTLKANFFHPMPLVHFCKDIEEQNDWDVLVGTDKTAKWIEPFKGNFSDYIKSEYGAFSIKSAGWMDIPLFLQKVKELFVSEKKYLVGSPNIGEEISVNASSFSFNNTEFQKVILCRGEFERNKNDFLELPYNPVKGQIFDIETDFDLEQTIFHKQVFMLPTGTRTARVGSTYTWDKMDYEIEQKDTDFLKERLDDFLIGEYKITEAKAGVRPAFHYGRPIYKEHEEIKNLFVLNGLGSKGVTLAPLFADELVRMIED